MKKLYTEEQKTKFNNDIGLVNPYPAYLPTQGWQRAPFTNGFEKRHPRKPSRST